MSKKINFYDTPYDLAVKAANRAMKENLECAAAHRRRMTAKQELKLASRHEVPKARAAFEAANTEWRRLNRVMAESEGTAA